MKILYVITRSEMGGSQTHLVELMSKLRVLHEVYLAVGEPGYLVDQAGLLGVNFFILPSLVQKLSPAQDCRAYLELRRLIRFIKPDLVHCHTSKAGILGRWAAFQCRVPSVFTAHTWSFADGTSRLWHLIGKPCERLAGRFTSAVIAVSESNRQLALEYKVVAPDRIRTIHNGVPDSLHRAYPGREEVPTILMVARFAPQKNQEELLRAVHGLTQPFRLQFIGDGPTMPAVRQLAEELQLTDRVQFLGTRTDTEVLLSQASIFVLATNWEGFPVTILEAMRAGLPVIATDVDGVSEAVDHGQTGYLYPRGNVGMLAQRLSELLALPFLRARLGIAGRRKFLLQFTSDGMVRKTLSVYNHVLTSGGWIEGDSQAAEQSSATGA